MNEYIRPILEQSPSIYLAFLRWKRKGHWSAKWIVSSDTAFCIEGFPRSANSFAHAALKNSQINPDRCLSATHTHSPTQIIQAVKLQVPTMVCMRPPSDAVCGLLAFDLQLAQRDGRVFQVPTPSEITRVAKRWEFFHRKIRSVRDGFYVAEFSRITSDFAAVSKEFIERFQLDLQPYDPNQVPPAQLMKAGFHVGPSEQRNHIKAEVRKAILETDHHWIWNRCNRLYEELKG